MRGLPPVRAETMGGCTAHTHIHSLSCKAAELQEVFTRCVEENICTSWRSLWKPSHKCGRITIYLYGKLGHTCRKRELPSSFVLTSWTISCLYTETSTPSWFGLMCLFLSWVRLCSLSGYWGYPRTLVLYDWWNSFWILGFPQLFPVFHTLRPYPCVAIIPPQIVDFRGWYWCQYLNKTNKQLELKRWLHRPRLIKVLITQLTDCPLNRNFCVSLRVQFRALLDYCDGNWFPSIFLTCGKNCTSLIIIFDSFYFHAHSLA